MVEHEQNPAADDYQQARVFYQTHREERLQQFDGRYVAILGSEVVDSDPEFDQLARRVYAKYGVHPIFMPQVLRSKGLVRMPSPRVRPPAAS